MIKNYHPIFDVFLLVFLIFSISSETHSQVFKKGKHYISPGLGFGIYKANTQIGDKIFSVREGSFVFPLNYEYALLDQVGLGLQLQHNLYFLPKDSSIYSRTSTNVISINNTLHFLNNEMVDLFLGISYGLSTYSHHAKSNHHNETLIKGLGFSYLVFSGVKYKITQRASIFVSLNYNNLFTEIHTYYINSRNEFEYNRENYNINNTGLNLQTGIVMVLGSIL